MRAAPSGAAVVAGYVTISNEGGKSDRLLSVTSPLAEHIEIREMTHRKGVIGMQQMQSLEIAPGAAVILRPAGFLLMFFKPNRALRPGGSVPAIFNFEKAGPIAVEFSVMEPRARGPSQSVD